MKRVTHALLILALAATGSMSQTERLVTRTYNAGDGLLSNNVHAVLQDDIGNLWVGTDAGLFLWLDHHFITAGSYLLGRYDRRIRTIVSLRKRTDVAVGGEGIVSEIYYESVQSIRRTGHHVRALLPDPDFEDTLARMECTALLETADGGVLIGTGRDELLVRPYRNINETYWAYRNVPLDRYRAGARVTALAADSAGGVWVGTAAGLMQFLPGRLIHADGAFRQLRRVEISALHVDARGTLWIGVPGAVYRYSDGQLVQAVRVPGTRVSALATRGDVLWVGTAGKGLFRWSNGALAGFGTKDGIGSDTVHAVMVDGNANVWVGTADGLTKILPVATLEFTVRDGMPHGGFSSGLLARDGSFWFGGVGTLTRFEGHRHTTYRAAGRVGGMKFRQMVDDDAGNIWVLVHGGVVRFDGRTFAPTLLTDPVRTDEAFHQIVWSSAYGLVYSTGHVMLRLSDGRFDTVYATSDRWSSIDMAFDAAGSLWFGNGAQLFRMDTAWSIHPVPGIVSVYKVWRAPNDSLAVLDQQFGVLTESDIRAAEKGVPAGWVRGRGHFPYAPLSGFVTREGRRFLTFADGLREQSSPGVLSEAIPQPLHFAQLTEVHSDDQGVLLATAWFPEIFVGRFRPSDGVIIPQTQLMTELSSHVRDDADLRLFSELPVDNVFQRWGRMLFDAEGRAWIATARGVTVIPPQARRPDHYPPIATNVEAGRDLLLPGRSPRIGALSVGERLLNQRRVDRFPSGFPDGSELWLPHRSNDIRVFLGSVNHNEELGGVVQVRLEGYDTGWKSLRLEPVARYADLPQGAYTLRIRGLSADGTPSPERHLRISIVVPFWKSTWFMIMSALTLVYGFVMAGRGRIAKLRDEHERMTREAVQENELRMARNVQMGMLPDAPPDLAGYDIAARSMPASEVGGDFYDFQQQDGELRISVGDVSGHGIMGAMIVGMARTSIRFAGSRLGKPARVLSLANDRLRQDISRNIFIAMFYGVLDLRKRRLRYICAGQPTPILIRKGNASFLPPSAGDRFPLGILPRVRYKEQSVALRTGDTVVMYTDGIAEAMNRHREEFGFDRLLDVLGRLAAPSSSAVIDGVLKEIAGHTQNASPEDDMTIVVLTVGKEKRS